MFAKDHTLANVDPELWNAIQKENTRQQDHIELIASENYTSPAVMEAQGSQLTNKYAEGYPGKRYYGGCEYVDVVEQLAIDRLKQLFGAEAANVQPNSGSQANQGVFFAMLKPGDTIMGMSLAEGGHLTHGMALNMSGKWFNVVSYGLTAEEDIDYDAMERLAHEHKPKMIIAGASAFSLKIDFERFAKVAKAVGAYFMVDMAHYAGLIAAGVYPNPVPHRRLRHLDHAQVAARPARRHHPDEGRAREGHQLGHLPRHPGRPADARDRRQGRRVQGSADARVQDVPAAGRQERRRAGQDADRARPAHRVGPHRIARDAGRPARQEPDRQGSRSDPGPAHMTCNKNGIPNDPQKPFVTSGIRLGSPAFTTRGFVEEDAVTVGNLIADVLDNPHDAATIERVKARSQEADRQVPGLRCLICCSAFAGRFAGPVVVPRSLAAPAP